MAPQVTPHHRYCVREGRTLFGLPRRTSHREFLLLDQVCRQQTHHRVERKERRRGARNRFVRPLALRLHAEMRSRFFKGHFHCPAPDKPFQYLLWFDLQVCRHERLRLELFFRITHQDPANGYCRHPSVIPETSSRRYLNSACACTIASLKRHSLPQSCPVNQHLFERRQACPFLARSPILASLPCRSRLKECRILSQAGDQTDLLTHSLKQFQSGKAAVSHDHYLTSWQPPLDQQEHLLCALCQLLVSASTLFVISLRRTQASQKGQRPDMSCPSDLTEQHQGQPAQATGFDKMCLRRAHRVTIDPFSLDLLPASSLNRIVETHDQDALWRKGVNQQGEQNPARGKTRPHGTVQDAMIVLEVLLVTQPHDAQGGSDSAFSWREQRALDEHLGMRPNRLGKEWSESYNQACQFGRHGQHQRPLLAEWSQAYRPSVLFSKIRNG